MSAARDVTVVIPTCRRPALLARAIRSVGQAARHGNVVSRVEVVIVDDGHDDETAAACAGIAAESPVPIRWARTAGGPGAGPAAARNQGVAAARGEFIYLLDDDDAFLPNRFAASLPLLAAGSHDAVLEPTRRIAQDGSRQPWVTGPYGPPGNAFRFLMEGGEASHVTPAATSFRKAVFQRLGGYDEQLRYGEDGELLLRTCMDARVALVTGEPVAECFVHGDNSTRADRLDYWQNLRALARLYAKTRARWPQEKEYVATALSTKLDYALSRLRHDCPSYGDRLRRGLRCLRWFDWRCLSTQNLASIGVWLLKPRPAPAQPSAREGLDC